MKTVIYCRVGNKSQTVEDQKELCMQVLEKGDELVGVFEDVGYGGINFNRPMLSSLMELASEGEFNKVVISDPSRLSREPLRIFEFMQCLEQLGVQLKFANGYDTQSAESVMRYWEEIKTFDETTLK